MNRRDVVRRSMLRVAVTGFGIGISSLALTCAQAQETKTYSYDALGRLVATNTNGGPNNGVVVGTCFDAVGNRTQYVVATTGAPCTTPPNAMQMQASTSTEANDVGPKASPPTPPQRRSAPAL